MITIGCNNDDCIHNNNGYCDFDGHINISCEFIGGCDEYLSYMNTPKYRERYFVARKETDKLPRHRIEKYGRRIEYNGYTFFTQSYDYEDDITQYVLTESKTGYRCGLLKELQKPELWQKFIENIKSISSVMNLPLAVWQDGEYVIVKEADND